MAIYLIQGKLGTGKSKFAVRKMQEALRAKKRVATNLDVNLERLVPEMPRASVVRVPDKPTAADLDACGHGNAESYDEERNGVMVLDELGSWLNSRSFQDKERQPVIDWLIHARKHGWDVYFICQNVQQIDKQVRESLCEYCISCMRLDKVQIPGLGWMGFRFPRMHVAQTRLGFPPNHITVDRDVFRGDDLHAAYDTRQVFRSNYPHGVHSVISPIRWQAESREKSPLWLWAVNLVLRPISTLRAMRSVAPRVLSVAAPAAPPAPVVAWVERLRQLPPDERIRAYKLVLESGRGVGEGWRAQRGLGLSGVINKGHKA